MRPIDADKILSDFPIRYDHYDKENGSEDFILGIETVMEYIDCIADEHPLDLASVVRCKDCKYNCSGYCAWHEFNPREDDFCSKGEQRNENDN